MFFFWILPFGSVISATVGAVFWFIGCFYPSKCSIGRDYFDWMKKTYLLLAGVVFYLHTVDQTVSAEMELKLSDHGSGWACAETESSGSTTEMLTIITI